MVYKIKDIPHMTSPVIRPKFSMGSSSEFRPKFRLNDGPAVQESFRSKFRALGDISSMDMDGKKHYIVSVVACIIIALIYVMKMKPDKVMNMDDPANPVVSPKLVFMYAVIPAILVGLVGGYVYENYIA